MNIYIRIVKPSSDILLALLAMIILSPVLIIVSIIIFSGSGLPVLFIQERLGRNGKVFKLYKYRSMVRDQKNFNKTTKLFEDDPRITAIGKIIRKTSLDELPQLINILKGEMSFIGPRPPVTYFPKKFEEYSEFEKERFNVKPGISGLAQTRCREIHDWNVNIPIDVEYVRSISFALDAKLFLVSLLTFFKTDNIYRKE